MTIERKSLKGRALSLIEELANGGKDDDARDVLLRDIVAWQARYVEPYRRLLAAKWLSLSSKGDVRNLPALPTDVFRYTRVAAHPESQDMRIFRTSGTSTETRGVHAFHELSLYDHAAYAGARYALFPDIARMPLVVLAPDERQAPDSSLSYMLSRFAAWFGTDTNVFAWQDGRLVLEGAYAALRRSEQTQEPVALLGTSFAFVHAEYAWGGTKFRLPHGSRIMQTGGFKGRAHEIEPNAMRALLSERYGIAEPWIIAEYGMTELSSQMYETTLRDETFSYPRRERHLWVPGWVRAEPVDPNTLRAVRDDEVGILRIDDVANLDSVCCVQTSDLARRVESGFVLLGRLEGATPRGCSIAADAALGGSRV